MPKNFLVPKKCPPTPDGWVTSRWRKHHDNCRRAEKLTGVVPFSAEGWEKIAVILMDRIEGKPEQPLYKKIRKL